MRIKVIQIEDGDSYKIGALSVDQVEEILGAGIEENKEGKSGVYDVIITSLNNPILDAARKAGTAPAPDDLWTKKKITAEFDLTSIEFVKSQVLEFSKLKQTEPTQGEAKAAE